MKIIAAILLALSFSASAEPTYLYTEVSQSGETMDEFMVRIAPKAVEYTLKNSLEVCGMIEKDGNEMKLNIFTDHKNNSCTIPVPSNSAGITFHTHPSRNSFKFHGKDFNVKGYLGTARGVRYQEGKGTERFVGRFKQRVTDRLLNSL